jgi:predicted permease
MSVLINVIVPVVIIISLAAVVKLLLRIEVASLSRLAFYLLTPALVFDALATSQVGGAQFGGIAAVVLLTTGVMWLLSAGAAHLLRLEGTTRSAFVVAVLLTNSGNMGLPINLFAFGEPGLALASLYFPLTATISATIGVFISARGRTSGRTAIRRALSVPMLYAAGFGLLANALSLTFPEPLMKGINLLGRAAVPVMLVILGMKLVEMAQDRGRNLHLPALGFVSVARLLVAPAVAFLFATLLGLSGLVRNVVVLETAMPTAVISTILATEFETDSSFAALCVLVTTIASIFTLTLLLNWLI